MATLNIPEKNVSKGDVDSPYRAEFERPQQIKLAFDHGLHLSRDSNKTKTA